MICKTKPKITRTCSDCQSDFQSYPHLTRQNRCPTCQTEYRRTQQNVWQRNGHAPANAGKSCEVCGEKLAGLQRRYCSRECYLDSTRSARPTKKKGRPFPGNAISWQVIKDPGPIPYARNAQFSLAELREMCKLGEGRINDGVVLQNVNTKKRLRVENQKLMRIIIPQA